jgi:aconitate hydratase
MMVEHRQVHRNVSFDINPASRQTLENLIVLGHLEALVRAGGRLHQTGCNGCIGMGQAPATDRASLRTVPRNFAGRSGSQDDRVYLCSPETATASALTGVITDPRSLEFVCPEFTEPERLRINVRMFRPPSADGRDEELIKGAHMEPLPKFDPLQASLRGPVLMKVGDDVSTDDIMPSGSQVLPLRSSVPRISRFAFAAIDPQYASRAAKHDGVSFIVAGHNYGQGSSREHAALGPRYLGMQAVIAKSFARIHRQNLINFAVMPLVFSNESDYDEFAQGDELEFGGLRDQLERDTDALVCKNRTRNSQIELFHGLDQREKRIVLQGGLINQLRANQ